MLTELGWVGAGLAAGVAAAFALQWWLRKISSSLVLDSESTDSSPVRAGELSDAGLPLLVILALVATTAVLAGWRQNYALLLSDSLLLAALTGIAWWDWQHLTIDIRLVALTALLQLGWAILLVPASTVDLAECLGREGCTGSGCFTRPFGVSRGLAKAIPQCWG